MSVFDKLHPLLVEAIPAAAASLKSPKPLSILRLYYYDTHAPCTYLLLKTVSAECRAKVVASKGPSAPYYIWGSGEECGDGQVFLPGERFSTNAEKQIAALFQRVYVLLCDDEDGNIVPFRKMLRQVARELNSKAWKPVCPVTDDFVVVPADGSQHFCDDYADIVASVSPAQLVLLRSHRLLGPAESWDKLP
jgi:hypothetical protein